MEASSPTSYDAPAGNRLRKYAASVLMAFVLGLAAAFYLAWSTGWLASDDAETPQQAAALPAGDGEDGDAELRAAAPVTPSTSSTLPADASMGMRVTELERRLNRLDLQAEAASGNAARAEGLLIAFASRRLVEQGAPLGYLENQLRLRFGNAQPNAVRTIINSARNPVTLDQLRQSLQKLPSTATETPDDLTGWAKLRAEIGNLFVLRNSDAPSPQPEVRLERAEQLLNDGRVEAAAALVARLPNREATADWLADARRFVATHQALDLIETAALLESRNLTDSSGQPVRQPSPAAPSGINNSAQETQAPGDASSEQAETVAPQPEE
ncbi:hypothetical protein [Croceicoccus mobilis]|uniref:Uncharacterized protein n=1 Tax=Croceicoccus mobilis TaxID=1703339 RepID=A0A916YX17_9SPHN|nr:hypothetical protein [Croceicoccus mobilis]GGD65285.1 hypothetical protein GCM10010990_13480 [Croceicoccus mobilis]